MYRRFTPTPIGADLRVMTRTIRLETNSRAIMAQVQQALRRYGDAHGEAPQFHWRLVGDAEAGLKPPWPDLSAFSNEGLRLVNLGPRSFWAADLEAREAVGFLAEELAQDVVGFNGLFLSRLFIMTAEALDLCVLSAAGVALEGRVRWAGYQNDPDPYYELFDVLVIPSTVREGLPLVALAALGWGVPVVGSRLGGIPEVVQEGMNGCLVPPGDERALAEGLERILGDSQLRARLQLGARASVDDRFSVETFCAAMRQTVSELCPRI